MNQSVISMIEYSVLNSSWYNNNNVDIPDKGFHKYYKQIECSLIRDLENVFQGPTKQEELKNVCRSSLRTMSPAI